MKTFEPAVNVRQDTSKKRMDGKSPLYIHVQWNRTRSKEATSIYLDEKDFRKKVWKTDRKLKKRLNEIDERVAELMAARKPFTAKECFGKVSSGINPEHIVNELVAVKRLTQKTAEGYSSTVRSLRLYFGDDVKLDELTLSTIQGYARSMGVSPVTVCTYLKKLNSLLNYCVGKGLLKENPMHGWKFKADGYKWKDKPRSLGRADLTYIIDRWREGNEAAGIFCAGYYFCGLALTDLINVDWDTVEETTVRDGRYYTFTVNRKKTKEVAHVMTPVIPLTRSLLKLVKSRPWMKRRNYGNWINRELKKIDPKITYYQCRHTFCSMMVGAGIPLNTISAMMGRSINGITAYITRITENESLTKAATALGRTELPETPVEDIWLE